MIFPYFVIPPQWSEAHTSANQSKTIKIVWKKYLCRYVWAVWEILAIRRSGHRGTSILIFWLNLVCWLCAVTNEPVKLLNPTVNSFIDITGRCRWMRIKIEGDDSLAPLSPRTEIGDDFHNEVMARWWKFGHNMQVVVCSNRSQGLGVSAPNFAKGRGLFQHLQQNAAEPWRSWAASHRRLRQTRQPSEWQTGCMLHGFAELCQTLLPAKRGIGRVILCAYGNSVDCAKRQL